ncbi:unnamed protein product [Vitrella brassicaformis CCMP3155]|uniref:Uncharacterized protein n=4 Tax=Vitrella brassicaformis TaxID=1169539 RepID=A0A0G4GJJ2_VITBC|nr:unnamed protein product [Vitrella brassicaformis CCMP3155]|eukprot:CEM30083.1 unnamed protein product [Vitrella brassicaformis CCMP3155]
MESIREDPSPVFMAVGMADETAELRPRTESHVTDSGTHAPLPSDDTDELAEVGFFVSDEERLSCFDFSLADRCLHHLFLLHSPCTVDYSGRSVLLPWTRQVSYLRPIYAIPLVADEDHSTGIEEYLLTQRCRFSYLYPSYSLVLVLDLSPSLNVVDTSFSKENKYSGNYLLDSLGPCLLNTLKALVQPMYVYSDAAKRTIAFVPNVTVSILAQGVPTFPVVTLVHGLRLTYERVYGKPPPKWQCDEDGYGDGGGCEDSSSCDVSWLHALHDQLDHVIAETCRWAQQYRNEEQAGVADGCSRDFHPCRSELCHATALDTFIKNAFHALSLLVEEGGGSCARGVVLLTDGVVSIPRQMHYDNILMHCNNADIQLNIVQVGGGFSPYSPMGNVSDRDALQFIANAAGQGQLIQDSDIAQMVEEAEKSPMQPSVIRRPQSSPALDATPLLHSASVVLAHPFATAPTHLSPSTTFDGGPMQGVSVNLLQRAVFWRYSALTAPQMDDEQSPPLPALVSLPSDPLKPGKPPPSPALRPSPKAQGRFGYRHHLKRLGCKVEAFQPIRGLPLRPLSRHSTYIESLPFGEGPDFTRRPVSMSSVAVDTFPLITGTPTAAGVETADERDARLAAISWMRAPHGHQHQRRRAAMSVRGEWSRLKDGARMEDDGPATADEEEKYVYSEYKLTGVSLVHIISCRVREGFHLESAQVRTNDGRGGVAALHTTPHSTSLHPIRETSSHSDSLLSVGYQSWLHIKFCLAWRPMFYIYYTVVVRLTGGGSEGGELQVTLALKMPSKEYVKQMKQRHLLSQSGAGGSRGYFAFGGWGHGRDRVSGGGLNPPHYSSYKQQDQFTLQIENVLQGIYFVDDQLTRIQLALQRGRELPGELADLLALPAAHWHHHFHIRSFTLLCNNHSHSHMQQTKASCSQPIPLPLPLPTPTLMTREGVVKVVQEWAPIQLQKDFRYARLLPSTASESLLSDHFVDFLLACPNATFFQEPHTHGYGPAMAQSICMVEVEDDSMASLWVMVGFLGASPVTASSAIRELQRRLNAQPVIPGSPSTALSMDCVNGVGLVVGPSVGQLFPLDHHYPPRLPYVPRIHGFPFPPTRGPPTSSHSHHHRRHQPGASLLHRAVSAQLTAEDLSRFGRLLLPIALGLDAQAVETERKKNQMARAFGKDRARHLSAVGVVSPADSGSEMSSASGEGRRERERVVSRHRSFHTYQPSDAMLAHYYLRSSWSWTVPYGPGRLSDVLSDVCHNIIGQRSSEGWLLVAASHQPGGHSILLMWTKRFPTAQTRQRAMRIPRQTDASTLTTEAAEDSPLTVDTTGFDEVTVSIDDGPVAPRPPTLTIEGTQPDEAGICGTTSVFFQVLINIPPADSTSPTTDPAGGHRQSSPVPVSPHMYHHHQYVQHDAAAAASTAREGGQLHLLTSLFVEPHAGGVRDDRGGICAAPLVFFEAIGQMVRSMDALLLRCVSTVAVTELCAGIKREGGESCPPVCQSLPRAPTEPPASGACSDPSIEAMPPASIARSISPASSPRPADVGHNAIMEVTEWTYVGAHTATHLTQAAEEQPKMVHRADRRPPLPPIIPIRTGPHAHPMSPTSPLSRVNSTASITSVGSFCTPKGLQSPAAAVAARPLTQVTSLPQLMEVGEAAAVMRRETSMMALRVQQQQEAVGERTGERGETEMVTYRHEQQLGSRWCELSGYLLSLSPDEDDLASLLHARIGGSKVYQLPSFLLSQVVQLLTSRTGDNSPKRRKSQPIRRGAPQQQQQGQTAKPGEQHVRPRTSDDGEWVGVQDDDTHEGDSSSGSSSIGRMMCWVGFHYLRGCALFLLEELLDEFLLEMEMLGTWSLRIDPDQQVREAQRQRQKRKTKKEKGSLGARSDAHPSLTVHIPRREGKESEVESLGASTPASLAPPASAKDGDSPVESTPTPLSSTDTIKPASGAGAGGDHGHGHHHTQPCHPGRYFIKLLEGGGKKQERDHDHHHRRHAVVVYIRSRRKSMRDLLEVLCSQPVAKNGGPHHSSTLLMPWGTAEGDREQSKEGELSPSSSGSSASTESHPSGTPHHHHFVTSEGDAATGAAMTVQIHICDTRHITLHRDKATDSGFGSYFRRGRGDTTAASKGVDDTSERFRGPIDHVLDSLMKVYDYFYAKSVYCHSLLSLPVTAAERDAALRLCHMSKAAVPLHSIASTMADISLGCNEAVGGGIRRILQCADQRLLTVLADHGFHPFPVSKASWRPRPSAASPPLTTASVRDDAVTAREPAKDGSMTTPAMAVGMGVSREHSRRRWVEKRQRSFACLDRVEAGASLSEIYLAFDPRHETRAQRGVGTTQVYERFDKEDARALLKQPVVFLRLDVVRTPTPSPHAQQSPAGAGAASSSPVQPLTFDRGLSTDVAEMVLFESILRDERCASCSVRVTMYYLHSHPFHPHHSTPHRKQSSQDTPSPSQGGVSSMLRSITDEMSVVLKEAQLDLLRYTLPMVVTATQQPTPTAQAVQIRPPVPPSTLLLRPPSSTFALLLWRLLSSTMAQRRHIPAIEDVTATKGFDEESSHAHSPGAPVDTPVATPVADREKDQNHGRQTDRPPLPIEPPAPRPLSLLRQYGISLSSLVDSHGQRKKHSGVWVSYQHPLPILRDLVGQEGFENVVGLGGVMALPLIDYGCETLIHLMRHTNCVVLPHGNVRPRMAIGRLPVQGIGGEMLVWLPQPPSVRREADWLTHMLDGVLLEGLTPPSIKDSTQSPAQEEPIADTHAPLPADTQGAEYVTEWVVFQLPQRWQLLDDGTSSHKARGMSKAMPRAPSLASSSKSKVMTARPMMRHVVRGGGRDREAADSDNAFAPPVTSRRAQMQSRSRSRSRQHTATHEGGGAETEEPPVEDATVHEAASVKALTNRRLQQHPSRAEGEGGRLMHIGIEVYFPATAAALSSRGDFERSVVRLLEDCCGYLQCMWRAVLKSALMRKAKETGHLSPHIYRPLEELTEGDTPHRTMTPSEFLMRAMQMQTEAIRLLPPMLPPSAPHPLAIPLVSSVSVRIPRVLYDVKMIQWITGESAAGSQAAQALALRHTSAMRKQQQMAASVVRHQQQQQSPTEMPKSALSSLAFYSPSYLALHSRQKHFFFLRPRYTKSQVKPVSIDVGSGRGGEEVVVHLSLDIHGLAPIDAEDVGEVERQLQRDVENLALHTITRYGKTPGSSVGESEDGGPSSIPISLAIDFIKAHDPAPVAQLALALPTAHLCPLLLQNSCQCGGAPLSLTPVRFFDHFQRCVSSLYVILNTKQQGPQPPQPQPPPADVPPSRERTPPSADTHTATPAPASRDPSCEWDTATDTDGQSDEGPCMVLLYRGQHLRDAAASAPSLAALGADQLRTVVDRCGEGIAIIQVKFSQQEGQRQGTAAPPSRRTLDRMEALSRLQEGLRVHREGDEAVVEVEPTSDGMVRRGRLSIEVWGKQVQSYELLATLEALAYRAYHEALAEMWPSALVLAASRQGCPMPPATLSQIERFISNHIEAAHGITPASTGDMLTTGWAWQTFHSLPPGVHYAHTTLKVPRQLPMWATPHIVTELASINDQLTMTGYLTCCQRVVEEASESEGVQRGPLVRSSTVDTPHQGGGDRPDTRDRSRSEDATPQQCEEKKDPGGEPPNMAMQPLCTAAVVPVSAAFSHCFTQPAANDHRQGGVLAIPPPDAEPVRQLMDSLATSHRDSLWTLLIVPADSSERPPVVFATLGADYVSVHAFNMPLQWAEGTGNRLKESISWMLLRSVFFDQLTMCAVPMMPHQEPMKGLSACVTELFPWVKGAQHEDGAEAATDDRMHSVGGDERRLLFHHRLLDRCSGLADTLRHPKFTLFQLPFPVARALIDSPTPPPRPPTAPPADQPTYEQATLAPKLPEQIEMAPAALPLSKGFYTPSPVRASVFPGMRRRGRGHFAFGGGGGRKERLTPERPVESDTVSVASEGDMGKEGRPMVTFEDMVIELDDGDIETETAVVGEEAETTEEVWELGVEGRLEHWVDLTPLYGQDDTAAVAVGPFADPRESAAPTPRGLASLEAMCRHRARQTALRSLLAATLARHRQCASSSLLARLLDSVLRVGGGADGELDHYLVGQAALMTLTNGWLLPSASADLQHEMLVACWLVNRGWVVGSPVLHPLYYHAGDIPSSAEPLEAIKSPSVTSLASLVSPGMLLQRSASDAALTSERRKDDDDGPHPTDSAVRVVMPPAFFPLYLYHHQPPAAPPTGVSEPSVLRAERETFVTRVVGHIQASLLARGFVMLTSFAGLLPYSPNPHINAAVEGDVREAQSFVFALTCEDDSGPGVLRGTLIVPVTVAISPGSSSSSGAPTMTIHALWMPPATLHGPSADDVPAEKQLAWLRQLAVEEIHQCLRRLHAVQAQLVIQQQIRPSPLQMGVDVWRWLGLVMQHYFQEASSGNDDATLPLPPPALGTSVFSRGATLFAQAVSAVSERIRGSRTVMVAGSLSASVRREQSADGEEQAVASASEGEDGTRDTHEFSGTADADALLRFFRLDGWRFGMAAVKERSPSNRPTPDTEMVVHVHPPPADDGEASVAMTAVAVGVAEDPLRRKDEAPHLLLMPTRDLTGLAHSFRSRATSDFLIPPGSSAPLQVVGALQDCHHHHLLSSTAGTSWYGIVLRPSMVMMHKASRPAAPLPPDRRWHMSRRERVSLAARRLAHARALLPATRRTPQLTLTPSLSPAPPPTLAEAHTPPLSLSAGGGWRQSPLGLTPGSNGHDETPSPATPQARLAKDSGVGDVRRRQQLRLDYRVVGIGCPVRGRQQNGNVSAAVCKMAADRYAVQHFRGLLYSPDATTLLELPECAASGGNNDEQLSPTRRTQEARKSAAEDRATVRSSIDEGLREVIGLARTAIRASSQWETLRTLTSKGLLRLPGSFPSPHTSSTKTEQMMTIQWRAIERLAFYQAPIIRCAAQMDIGRTESEPAVSSVRGEDGGAAVVGSLLSANVERLLAGATVVQWSECWSSFLQEVVTARRSIAHFLNTTNLSGFTLASALADTGVAFVYKGNLNTPLHAAATAANPLALPDLSGLYTGYASFTCPPPAVKSPVIAALPSPLSPPLLPSPPPSFMPTHDDSTDQPTEEGTFLHAWFAPVQSRRRRREMEVTNQLFYWDSNLSLLLRVMRARQRENQHAGNREATGRGDSAGSPASSVPALQRQNVLITVELQPSLPRIASLSSLWGATSASSASPSPSRNNPLSLSRRTTVDGKWTFVDHRSLPPIPTAATLPPFTSTAPMQSPAHAHVPPPPHSGSMQSVGSRPESPHGALGVEAVEPGIKGVRILSNVPIDFAFCFERPPVTLADDRHGQHPPNEEGESFLTVTPRMRASVGGIESSGLSSTDEHLHATTDDEGGAMHAAESFLDYTDAGQQHDECTFFVYGDSAMTEERLEGDVCGLAMRPSSQADVESACHLSQASPSFRPIAESEMLPMGDTSDASLLPLPSPDTTSSSSRGVLGSLEAHLQVLKDSQALENVDLSSLGVCHGGDEDTVPALPDSETSGSSRSLLGDYMRQRHRASVAAAAPVVDSATDADAVDGDTCSGRDGGHDDDDDGGHGGVDRDHYDGGGRCATTVEVSASRDFLSAAVGYVMAWVFRNDLLGFPDAPFR